MENILKIVAAAVAAAMYAVVVKQRVQEVGLVFSLAAGALVLTMALGTAESMRALMDELGEAVGLSPAVLVPVLKTMDITILTHIPVEVCRGARGSGIAAFMGTARVIVALCVTFPLPRAVLDTMTRLL